jgi:hypothetical protein
MASLIAPLGDDPAEPGMKMAAYARGLLGKKVGNGECTALVTAALKEAGLSCCPEGDEDDDYVWGTLVEKRSEIRPGDILQFRDAVFISRRRKVRDGTVVIDISKRTMTHHTAIVEAVQDKGRILTVLHQNTGPDDAPPDQRRLVQRDTLRLADLRAGTVKAYRPLASNDSSPPRDN